MNTTTPTFNIPAGFEIPLWAIISRTHHTAGPVRRRSLPHGTYDVVHVDGDMVVVEDGAYEVAVDISCSLEPTSNGQRPWPVVRTADGSYIGTGEPGPSTASLT